MNFYSGLIQHNILLEWLYHTWPTIYFILLRSLYCQSIHAFTWAQSQVAIRRCQGCYAQYSNNKCCTDSTSYLFEQNSATLYVQRHMRTLLCWFSFSFVSADERLWCARYTLFGFKSLLICFNWGANLMLYHRLCLQRAQFHGLLPEFSNVLTFYIDNVSREIHRQWMIAQPSTVIAYFLPGEVQSVMLCRLATHICTLPLKNFLQISCHAPHLHGVPLFEPIDSISTC